MRIGIVAPSTPVTRSVADQVIALAAALDPAVELVFHPQCFLEDGHFAGADPVRAAAFVEMANDPALAAVWFARGGYGACRIAEDVLARLGLAARAKTYLGYSDAGFLLAGLYRERFGAVAHGPMPQDVLREDGAVAIARALGWLARRASGALEPSVAAGARHVAFNTTVLSHLLGTALEPHLADHVLMLEDVAEYTYRTDRAMFHITAHPAVRRVSGIRFGRFSLVPENDRAFGADEEAVVRHWCARAQIPFLGVADIGHDAANRVVPFGRYDG